jgi:hypothetical protein
VSSQNTKYAPPVEEKFLERAAGASRGATPVGSWDKVLCNVLAKSSQVFDPSNNDENYPLIQSIFPPLASHMQMESNFIWELLLEVG